MPMAPASSASVSRVCMASISPGVAARSTAVMVVIRRVVCPTMGATLTEAGACRSAAI